MRRNIALSSVSLPQSLANVKEMESANVRRCHSSPSSVYRYRFKSRQDHHYDGDDDEDRNNYSNGGCKNCRRNNQQQHYLCPHSHQKQNYLRQRPIYPIIHWLVHLMFFPLFLFREFLLRFILFAPVPISNFCYHTCCLVCGDVQRPLAFASRIFAPHTSTLGRLNCNRCDANNNQQDSVKDYRSRNVVESATTTGSILGSLSLWASPPPCHCCQQQPDHRRRSNFGSPPPHHHGGMPPAQSPTEQQQQSDLFNALSMPTPSMLNFGLKTLLDLTQISALLDFTQKMRQRARKIFRWTPTSSEELDEAEKRVLSYLTCNYKTYYVDIGSRWDLDHVRIWTIEIEPDNPSTSIRISQPDIPDLLNHDALQKSSSVPAAQQQNLPLVMVHGFAAGIGLWGLNFNELARRGYRKIYAFDVLGFAKSSRPKFPVPPFKDMTTAQRIKAEAEVMEEYYVESIEKWRLAMGEPLQNKFILMGHSFGAYLALAYTLRHPSHVAHVILADAWGLPGETNQRHIAASGHINTRQLPFWARFLGRMFLEVFNPLSLLRASGPGGPKLIKALRPDIKRKFEPLTLGGQPTRQMSAAEKADHPPPLDSGDDLDSGDELDHLAADPEAESRQYDFLDYIYHCNAQRPPSGEIAFKTLCTPTAWPRLPMLERIHDLDTNIGLTFIYGSRSWIDRQSGLQAKYILATTRQQQPTVPYNNNNSSDETDDETERVNVHVIPGAGHHVYADKPEEFNDLVLSACAQVDGGGDGGCRPSYRPPTGDEDDGDDADPMPTGNGRAGGGSISGSSSTPPKSSSSVNTSASSSTSPYSPPEPPQRRVGRKYGNYLEPSRLQQQRERDRLEKQPRKTV